MSRVVIYTTAMCGYCARAKRLLTNKGISFEEIDVTFDPERRREMMERAGGRRTVPQVFIDGDCLGGADELLAIDREGRLDDLLAA